MITKSEAKKAEHRGNLNETRVVTAPVIGNVFRDVDRRAAIFAANGKPLHRANDNENYRRNPTAGFEAGEKPDQRGRPAHHAECHKKRVLAAHQVPDTAEKQRAERPHDEPDGERGKIGNVRESLVARRIEFLREHCCEAAEDKKVVPLDHRAGGGGENHAPDAAFGKGMDVDRRAGGQ